VRSRIRNIALPTESAPNVNATMVVGQGNRVKEVRDKGLKC
jgi:hypothetical protein